MLEKAQQVLEELPVQEIVSLNALISGYSEHGQGEKALECYERMKLDDVYLTAATCVSTLKACAIQMAEETGLEIHSEIARRGFFCSDLVSNTLVDMYVKFGFVDKAQEVFFELPIRNVVIWTALLAGFVQHGVTDKAHWCFQQMQLEGVPPNAVTYACSLKACSILKSWEKGREIHTIVQCMELLEKDLYVGSSLVDMYTKCKYLLDACMVMVVQC